MPGRIGMTGSAPSSDADDVDAAVEVSLVQLGDGGHAEAYVRPAIRASGAPVAPKLE
eukprot:CAMPEP_0204035524 /NCGR_PEP_ID=MMETSP0360-20130528/76442_1 /ASSEMBLY_ACC=CAM_ASM_000342 /TAXON_ID=268821 /ORGANISM="Scrippsiella Hangoei, Strain SHTV-5" /LENGTH=56 /DNA_ID=CAMNT_0050980531 /DNA_START=90 /DNA_END=258 /DNA_ORIENTATION=-